MLAPLAAVGLWLVPFVFGLAYIGAVPLLWLLTPGAVFFACGKVTGDLLRGSNRPVVVAWAQGLAAVFTVVLLFALLPVLGVAGAAIASTSPTASHSPRCSAFLRRLAACSERCRSGGDLRGAGAGAEPCSDPASRLH